MRMPCVILYNLCNFVIRQNWTCSADMGINACTVKTSDRPTLKTQRHIRSHCSVIENYSYQVIRSFCRFQLSLSSAHLKMFLRFDVLSLALRIAVISCFSVEVWVWYVRDCNSLSLWLHARDRVMGRCGLVFSSPKSGWGGAVLLTFRLYVDAPVIKDWF